MLPDINLPEQRKRSECCRLKCMYKYCISDVLCQVYLFFVFLLICTEIVVAVLLPFFRSSPSCFMFNAKFLCGSCTCRFSENTPSDLMCFCLWSALHPQWCTPEPHPHGELNPTVTVRSVSCAEMRRVHLKTAGTTTVYTVQRAASLGPALRSRKSSRKFPQPPPLRPPCSPGHWVSARILSSNTINIITIKKEEEEEEAIHKPGPWHRF